MSGCTRKTHFYFLLNCLRVGEDLGIRESPVVSYKYAILPLSSLNGQSTKTYRWEITTNRVKAIQGLFGFEISESKFCDIPAVI